MMKRRIAELVKHHGSLRAVARHLDVDVGYLCRLRDGKKINPSPPLLKKLGLKKIVQFRFVKAGVVKRRGDTKIREPLNELMDRIFEEKNRPMSATEMTKELTSRGWLPEFHTVLDIADEMKQWYGKCSSTP